MTTPAIELDISVEDDRWSAQLAHIETLVERAIHAALAAGEWPEAAHGAAVCGLSVVLADDATVHELNRTYRGKDKPTNVLSFALLDGIEAEEVEQDFHSDHLQDTVEQASGMPILLGDVILAFETVAAESAQQDKPLADHVTHLVIHGVLHLLGYDHETDADAERMERLETEILQQLGIADPYADDRGAQQQPHHGQ